VIKGIILVWGWLMGSWVNGARAADEFESNFQVRYEVTGSGKTVVEQRVALTNLLVNVYASQYTLTISGLPQKLTVQKEGKNLPAEIKRQEKGTLVTVDFTEPVVGKGERLVFELSYEIEGIAKKKGQIWEINLPRLTESEEVNTYEVILVVPENFGLPAILKPRALRETREGGYRSYFFDKKDLAANGGAVNAVFGNFQIFDFTMDYQLENIFKQRAVAEIVLPPETVWQKVIYQRLEPEPERVRVDEDGNWLAKYELAAEQKLKVAVAGQALIFAEPQEEYRRLLIEPGITNWQEQKFWPVNDGLIKEKSQKLKTIKDIYDFVVRELNYDFDRVGQKAERLGAKQVLLEPNKAVCLEFADLFVTLARAAKIPAREVEGYAFTDNPQLKPLGLVTDILHAWPEFWDGEKKLWRPVDPTWEKTTGGVDFFSKTDLNHFAFVIHGQNSERPFLEGKNIKVNYGSNFGTMPEPEIEVKVVVPDKLVERKDQSVKIVLKNIGGVAKYNYRVNLKMEGREEDRVAKMLPPRAQEIWEIPWKTEIGWKRQKKRLEIVADSKNYDRMITIGSHFDSWIYRVRRFFDR
jgi:hypothetical protein